jgi:hypothetical protein
MPYQFKQIKKFFFSSISYYSIYISRIEEEKEEENQLFIFLIN